MKKGETIERGENSVSSPQTIDGPLSDKALKAMLGREATFNRTELATIEILGERLGDGAPKIAIDILQTEIVKSVEQVNHLNERVLGDRTKTMGQKVLVRDGAIEKITAKTNKAVDRVGRESMISLQAVQEKLFTHDMILDAVEQSILPTMLDRVTGSDATDLGSFIGNSPSETKVALAIAERFPSMLPDTVDLNHMRDLANMAHTPTEQKQLETLKELNGAVQKFAKSHRTNMASLSDQDTLEMLKSGRV